MDIHRFGDVPINLDTLDRGEVLQLNRYAHERLGQALGEIAALNRFMHTHGYYGVEQAFPPPNLDYEHDPFGDVPPQEAA